MGRWLEHSVTTDVQASAERVWEVWSDLEAMPRWMNWIESMVTEPGDPDLTELASNHDRSLGEPVAQPAGEPGQKDEGQNIDDRADGQHCRMRAADLISSVLAEANHQPTGEVVVENRQDPHSQQVPKRRRFRSGIG